MRQPYSRLFAALLKGLAAASLTALTTLTAAAQSPAVAIEGPDYAYAHMFGDLEAAYVPGGVLLHAALPLEEPLWHLGKHEPHDGLRLTPERFGNLAFALQTGLRDKRLPALFDTGFSDYVEHEPDDQRVHYAGLRVRAGVFDDEAFNRGRLTVSADETQILQGPNISSEAYVEETVFAFSTLAKEFPSGPVTHVFRPEHFYGNLPWDVPLQFDPGDGGGFRTIQLGQELTTNYTGVDTARLELRYTSDGVTYRAYSWAPIQPARGGRPSNMTTVFEDVAGTEIEVLFANPDCPESWFANSLIVVDGIDPTAQRQFVTFQIAYDKYELQQIDGVSVSDLIADQGYDFVFINFDDGGQSVESTAQILKDAIRWINAEKRRRGNAGDNIVLGHSMGGLTAKWALSEMAEDGEAHGASKLFTFDSPLQGAHVPIGLQMLLQYLINLTVEAADEPPIRLGDLETLMQADGALNTVAAQQLIAIRASAEAYISGGVGRGYSISTFGVDNEVSDNFYDAFRALPPLDIPHYAISDGARNFDQVTGTSDSGPRIRPEGLIATLQILSGRCENDDLTFPECLFRFRNFGTFEFGASTYFSPGAFTANSTLSFYFQGYRISRFRHNVHVDHARLGLPGDLDLRPGALGNDGIAELGDAANTPQMPGDFIATAIHTDHYMFVPTSSALDIAPSQAAPVTGCGLGLAGCITAENGRIDARSNFVTPTANHEHVTLTPLIARDFLERAFETPGVRGPGAATEGILDEPYVYGVTDLGDNPIQTPNRLTTALTVIGDGRLLVTRAGQVGPESAANGENVATSFELTIDGANCEGLGGSVDLRSGTRFYVGDGDARTGTVNVLGSSSVTIGAGAAMTAYQGSVVLVRSSGVDGAGGIVVEAGGRLSAEATPGSQDDAPLVSIDGGSVRVRDGGRLRISRAAVIEARNGGRLILEDGAIVEFVDPEHPDESDGVLSIAPGGRLDIRGDYDWSGPGYLYLNDENAVTGAGDLVLTGSSRRYRRLRTGRNVLLAPGQNLRLGILRFDADLGGVGVRDGGELRVVNADVTGGANALTTDGTGSAHVRHTNFAYSESGILLDSPDPVTLLSFRVEYCDFFECIDGVQIHGDTDVPSGTGLPLIKDCDFTSVHRGVVVENFPTARLLRLGFAEETTTAVYAERFHTVSLVDCEAASTAPFARLVDVGRDADTPGGNPGAPLGGTVFLDGGSYRGSGTGSIGVAARDVTVDLRDCVEIGGHDGAAVDIAGGTLELAGAQITDSRYGLYVYQAEIERPVNDFGDRLRNTLGRLTGPDPANPGQLYPGLFMLRRYAPGTPGDQLGETDLRDNAWVENGQPATPTIHWFCNKYLNNHCFAGAQTGGAGEGCGTECDTPDCEDFCTNNPDAPGCLTGPHCEEPGVTAVFVYPNPANDYAIVEGLTEEEVVVEVFTLQGRPVDRIVEHDCGGSLRLNANQLVPGGYFVEVEQYETNNAGQLELEEHSMHNLIIMEE